MTPVTTCDLNSFIIEDLIHLPLKFFDLIFIITLGDLLQNKFSAVHLAGKFDKIWIILDLFFSKVLLVKVYQLRVGFNNVSPILQLLKVFDFAL